MSYLKQEFIIYLRNNLYSNTEGYCYALEKIERDFQIDIDEEFQKDKCYSLCNRINQKCISMEESGRNTNTERTYLSRLKKYIAFKQQLPNSTTEELIQRRLSIEALFEIYFNNFFTRWEEIEIKWRAVKIFQENWNINAPDFIKMFKTSTTMSSFISLYGGISKRKILHLAQQDITSVKVLFENLFNEEEALEIRSNVFYEDIGKLSEKYDTPIFDKNIAVYLFLKYPEKYYVYKSNDILALKKIVLEDENIRQSGTKTQKMLNAYSLLDEVKVNMLQNESFCNDYKKFIQNQGYTDDNMHCPKLCGQHKNSPNGRKY